MKQIQLERENVMDAIETQATIPRIAEGNGISELCRFTRTQQMVYNALMSGKKVFYTWPIASGKTYLYEAIKEDLAKIQKVVDAHFKEETNETDST